MRSRFARLTQYSKLDKTLREQSEKHEALSQKVVLNTSQMKLLEQSGGGETDKKIEGQENIKALKENIMAEVNVLLSAKLAEAVQSSEERTQKKMKESIEEHLKPIEAKLESVQAENGRLKQQEADLARKVDEIDLAVSKLTKNMGEVSQEKIGTHKLTKKNLTPRSRAWSCIARSAKIRSRRSRTSSPGSPRRNRRSSKTSRSSSPALKSLRRKKRRSHPASPAAPLKSAPKCRKTSVRSSRPTKACTSSSRA